MSRNKLIDGVSNFAHPNPQEVIVRQTHVKHTEYTVIESVYPAQQEVVYIDYKPPQRLGFLGWVGVTVFAAVVFFTVTSFAQSNVKQFYGHGDYGSNRQQVIIVPVPIQPQQNYSGYHCVSKQDQKYLYETCYQDGLVDSRCRITFGNGTVICDNIPSRSNDGVTYYEGK